MCMINFTVTSINFSIHNLLAEGEVEHTEKSPAEIAAEGKDIKFISITNIKLETSNCIVLE